MILPLVIAAVMAVIYIVISLYLSLSLQTSLHLALRKESGELAKTVYRTTGTIREFRSSEELVKGRLAILMEEEREYQVKSLFANRVVRKEMGRSYVLDEAELDRMLSFKEAL
jgi:hypothetical protein